MEGCTAHNYDHLSTQVRVNIHEGRKLLGGNIHPVCNIHVGMQSKHTRVQKSTNKPLWDEVSLSELLFLSYIFPD